MAVLRVICVLFVLAAMTACAAAGDLGIGSLLVGKQVLAVADTRQLTLRADGEVKNVSLSPDGKYVVYLAEKLDALEWRLAKITTGKTATILSQPAGEAARWDSPPRPGVLWMLDCPEDGSLQRWLRAEKLGVTWSPDSKSFAFLAARVELAKGPASEWPVYALVYSAIGTFKTSLPLPATCEVVERLLFTPDSRQLVLNLVLKIGADQGQITERKPILQSVDIATGASRDVYASTTSNLVGFSDNGSLLFVIYDKAGGQLHEIALDGSADQVIVANCSPAERTCPNGSLAVADSHGLMIKNQMTAKQVELTNDPAVSFRAWTPNSKMLLYGKSESLEDAARSRRREFHSLWLSGLAPGKLDSMCVALDAEDKPSCSRDGRGIAYVSQGQLYIAELALRESSIDEKLAVGIPLTEEETKSVLMANAKQIGAAIKMYFADHHGDLPPADSVTDALQEYVRSIGTVDIFRLPGTDQNAFRYIGPGVKNESEIEASASTVLGELDAGYRWIIVLYADGHVVSRPKQ